MAVETAVSQPMAMNRVVDFTLTRRDIWQLNLEIAPRLAVTWWMLLIFCILIAALSVGSTCIVCGDGVALGAFLTRLGLSVGAAIVAFPVVCLVLSGFAILFVSPHWKVLGDHSVKVRSDGLFVSSRAGQGSHSWSAIRSVFRTENWLLIRIRPYRFYAVPARAFRSRAGFEFFSDDVVGCVAAAKERRQAAPA